VKLPSGMWHSAVQTRFSKTVRFEAAIRASSFSIVVGFEDSIGDTLVTLSGGLESSELSSCLRLMDMIKDGARVAAEILVIYANVYDSMPEGGSVFELG